VLLQHSSVISCTEPNNATFLHMSSMKYIYKCGRKTIMENLCGESVNSVELEGLEIV